jgi:hypothetical protein
MIEFLLTVLFVIAVIIGGMILFDEDDDHSEWKGY